LWWFYSGGQLSSTTTALSFLLLKRKGEKKCDEKGRRADRRTGRSLYNYHHRQNRLSIERLMKFITYYCVINKQTKTPLPPPTYSKSSP